VSGVSTAPSSATEDAAVRVPPAFMGLVFTAQRHRLAAAALASRVWPAAAAPVFPCLELRRLPRPSLPGPQWLFLRPYFVGICGSDVSQACLRADADNPLSAVVSFPHVMGHEVVAKVVEPGPAIHDLDAGTWVVVDPWLGCWARGLWPPCPACRAGQPPLCSWADRSSRQGTRWGMHLGNIRGLPGGFATLMVAHRSQCHVIPAGVSPEWGVLADPLAVASHAVSRTRSAVELAVVILSLIHI